MPRVSSLFPSLRRFTPVRTLARSLAIAGSVVATALVAQPASAQFGGQSGFADAFTPDYLRRDMTLFNTYLELEDWQRPIIEVLLEDYHASFRAGVDDVRDELRNVMKDEVAAAGMNATGVIMRPIETWMVEKNRLASELLANVKSQLSERQQQLWPRFERALRREKLLPRGEISGESVNLVGVINQLQLPPDLLASLRPAIDEYEIQLDSVLQNREQVVDTVQPKVKDAMINMDFDTGMQAMEQIMAARIQVRAVQDANAQRLAEALGTQYADEFMVRFYEQAYPKVFRPSPMERTFKEVYQLADLTEDQRAQVKDLERSYNADYDTHSMQILEVLKVEEPKEARRKAEQIRSRQEREPGVKRTPKTKDKNVDPLTVAFDNRDALYEPTMARLRQILTPEQYARLPENVASRRSKAQQDPERLEALGRGPGTPAGTLGGKGDPPQRQPRDEKGARGQQQQPQGSGIGSGGGSSQRGSGGGGRGGSQGGRPSR